MSRVESGAHLFIDPSGGMSGDMFLAGLCALGFEIASLEDLFRRAGLKLSLKAECVSRHGLSGRCLSLDFPTDQPLRHLPQIITLLEGLDISRKVFQHSLGAFERLAAVEAEVHGIAPDQVHFHEVGALDTVIDVVGAFFALEALALPMKGIFSAPLPWFSGTVECAHGLLPLPAPATARLMLGKPVRPSQAGYELITPTGALLLDRLCADFINGPEGVIKKSGLAFGAREQGQGLRLFLFEPVSADGAGGTIERIWSLESHIDHLTGEELGCFFEALMRAGALDVFYQPGVMKKNRPAGALTVLCRPEHLNSVQEAFFAHSLTLGLRRSLMERVSLPRSAVKINTPLGELEAKEFILNGRRIIRPEHEAMAALADKTGRSVPELRLMLGIDFLSQEWNSRGH